MLSQPVRPTKPSEPRKPEQFYTCLDRVEVKDATYSIDLTVDYDDPGYAKLDYLTLTPDALQAVIRTMNLVSNEKGISVEQLGFMCFDDILYVTYEVSIENPNYSEQLKRYEESMESYRRQVASFEADMAKYQNDYDEYERYVQGQIIAARRRLEELEAKRKTP